MKLLLISSIVALMSFTVLQKSCDDLKFDIKITSTSSGLDNGKIEVTIIKSTSNVRAYLYGDTRKKNKLDVSVDDLINLEAGTYTLVLQNNDCSAVKRDIEIK